MRPSSLAACVGVLSIGALAPLVAATPVAACSYADEQPFIVDPSLSDTSPPTPFGDVVATVTRVTSTRCDDGTCTSNSCGDYGVLELTFERPVDDSGAELGYRVMWVSGTRPQSTPAEHQTRSLGATNATLELTIGYEEAARLDGELVLIAVDRAGNESQASAPVRVEFSGCTRYAGDDRCTTARTCSIAGAPGSAGGGSESGLGIAVTLTLAAIGGWWRRRRRLVS